MKKVFFLALSAILSYSGQAYSQNLNWARTAGPRGGVVLSMVYDPLTTKVWSGNGFYSSDNGNTWLAKANGLVPGSLQSHFAMAVSDSGTLYAGNFGGMNRSTDGGDTWTAVFIPGFPSVVSIAAQGSDVWVGSYGGKIYHSKDKGNIWYIMHDSSDFNTDVLAMAVYYQTVYAGTYGNGVMKSTDGGQTWKPASNGISSGVESLFLHPATSNELHAGTNGGIYSTGDGGGSWGELLSIFGDVFSFAYNETGGYFYAATSIGFYRSAGGATWTASNTGFTRLDLSAVVFDKKTGSIFVGTSGGGVFRSTNNGDSWEQVGTPVTVFSITAYQGKNILAGTNNGLFSTKDAGNSWPRSDTGISYQVSDLVFTAPNGKMFAATHKGVYRSDDNAATWTFADSGITNHVYHAMISKGNKIFLATGGGLFESGDGTYWSLKTGLLDTVIWDSSVAAIAFDAAGYLYAAKSSGIYRSGDDGNSWQLVNVTLPGNVYSLFGAPNGDVLAGLGYTIYRSSDIGVTWSAATVSINSAVNQMILAGNNIFAATSGDGVLVSTDNGGSWSAANTGLASLTVYSLAVTDDGYLWAGTADGGVFRASLNPSAVKDTKKNDGFETSMYPNPSHGTFYVETEENATFEVEDATGKQVYVSSVAGGMKNEIRLNNIANGFYFVRITTKDRTIVRSISIVR